MWESTPKDKIYICIYLTEKYKVLLLIEIGVFIPYLIFTIRVKGDQIKTDDNLFLLYLNCTSCDLEYFVSITHNRDLLWGGPQAFYRAGKSCMPCTHWVWTFLELRTFWATNYAHCGKWGGCLLISNVSFFGAFRSTVSLAH